MLPPLPYAYDALEPHIDAQTMQLHHDVHHAGYVAGLNAAEDTIAACNASGDYSRLKEALYAQAFHSCGHFLHSVFWQNMAPVGTGGQLSAELRAQVEKDFGSVEALKSCFLAAGKGVEGSGWAMLLSDGKQLKVGFHHNHQNSSLGGGFTPVLVCDVWEHAYYLRYQNRRAEYLEHFWQVINWADVSERFAATV